MGTIAGIIATFAVSHLGGSAIGGILASQGWLGFAGEAGKLIVKRRRERRFKKAQADYQAFLDEANPETDE